MVCGKAAFNVIIFSFIDKYTGEDYAKGAEIEVSKERFEEINSTALGILVEKAVEKKTSKK
jgi:hypothetical protein